MKIKEKLRSSKGASLIIALVFMLFCAMVGSAVLAAATANGGRVAALKSDQQEYLDQRSAATLLSDELQIDRPKLIVTKEHVVSTTYEVGDGGVLKPIGTPQESDTVKFEVSGNVTTQLQRVLFESAILRYMQVNDMKDQYKSDIVNGFNVPGLTDPVTKPSGFLIYDEGKVQNPVATINVALSEGAVGNSKQINSFTATVGCSGKNTDPDATDSRLYCFNVDFGNEALGIDSKLYLRMYATMSQPRTITVQEQLPGSSANRIVKVDTTTTTQTISWDAPEILKGAAKWN